MKSSHNELLAEQEYNKAVMRRVGRIDYYGKARLFRVVSNALIAILLLAGAFIWWISGSLFHVVITIGSGGMLGFAALGFDRAAKRYEARSEPWQRL